LHQRILKSLEKNKNNSMQNEINILLNKNNISNNPNSALNSFKTLNFEENKLPNMNSTIEEKKFLKTEQFEGNKILPKNKISYKKEHYLKPSNKKFFDSMNIQEINNQKLNSISFLKENFSNFKTKENKRIIFNNFTNDYNKIPFPNNKLSAKSLIPKYNVITSQNNLYSKEFNNFTNGYNKNPISNNKLSVKSLIPTNNVITSQNNLYYTNNNKLQRINDLKDKFNLKKYLNIKINNNRNNYSKIKDQLQNQNSYNF
jgi:hypothetical protein